VCATDPLCCTQDWDASCVAVATANCPNCGDSSLGSCFAARQVPYCSDSSCCEEVCSADPSCCNTSWDVNCVNTALVRCASCGTSNASCFLPHAGTGCSDLSCCQAVCALDLSCCESAWDANCAQLAAAQCTPKCGDPGAGSCFSAHASPACRDGGCCSIVCTIDPFCCATAWDEGCVAIASAGVCQQYLCGDSFLQPCSQTSANPACRDAQCCQAVCAISPTCCDIAWDAACVNLVPSTCGTTCGDPSLQPCSQTSTAPNCSNAQCCQAVCAIDPTCCQTAWDEGCVAATAQACTACSTAGDCNANGVPDDCDIAGGSASDANQNGVPDQCECIGDLDGNGSINAADLAGILNAWGPVTGANAAADLDGSGTVNAADLAALLNAWGLCPNAVGDEAATAIDIAPGASASFNTIFKTPSPNPPENGSCQFLEWTANTRDIWYRVQTGAGGQLGVNLCDSSYDTSMVVYSVSPQGVLTRIACDDDSCQPTGPIYQSRINGLAVTGTVLVRIGGFGNSAGAGVIRVTLGP
ncbi:MAG: dockerin type I domain-containing protein, partial [bacterium]